MSLRGWLEERSGAPSAARRLLEEPVPGGARLAYAFGAALLALLAVQVATGVGLALYYSPSQAGAWASVFYVETQVAMGRLLRGLHHHGASAMVVVVGLHAAQALLFGAHRRPRELNWVTGVLLFSLLLAFALTGYLLPWDQRGYWATRVATSMAGTAPLVGPALERLVQGGERYGTLTLTRFYVAHVVLLPAALAGLLALHLFLFRRHGVTPGPPLPPPGAAAEPFWPGQAARDALLAVVAVGALLVLASKGAPLEAPADPTRAPLPRPEWYFLGLFQLQKLFHGRLEPLGTFILPPLAAALLLAIPFLDRGAGRGLRQRRGALAAGALAIAYAGLTAAAIQADRRDPSVAMRRRLAEREAARAKALAARGIPPEGAAAMVARDPVGRGSRLFEVDCKGCHAIAGDGEQKAPDLGGFLSRSWIADQIRDPNQPHRFGRTKLKGKMEAFGKRLAPERIEALAAWLHARREPGRAEAPEHAAAVATFRRVGCSECHPLEAGKPGDAPNLHDYGSDTWIARLLEDPGSALYYGAHNGMPAMRGRLAPADLDALVAYLRTLEQEPTFAAAQLGATR